MVGIGWAASSINATIHTFIASIIQATDTNQMMVRYLKDISDSSSLIDQSVGEYSSVQAGNLEVNYCFISIS